MCPHASASTAQQLIARRRQLLGPAYRLFYDRPLHLVRGEGVWLYDAEGRAYLDVYNNVAHVGHCHPHVVDALARQAETLNTNTRYLHPTVLDYADRKKVVLGFEPEPGMLIDTMDSFAELVERMDAPHLALTLDVGHLHCLDEGPINEVIRRWSDRLVNVHIEDMRRSVHEHLMFGEGEIDFPPIFAALEEVQYEGGLHVELSRHSHDGPAAAKQSATFLRRLSNKG